MLPLYGRQSVLTSDAPLARKALIASSFSSGHGIGEEVPSTKRRDSTAKSWVADGRCMAFKGQLKAMPSPLVIAPSELKKRMVEKKTAYVRKNI